MDIRTAVNEPNLVEKLIADTTINVDAECINYSTAIMKLGPETGQHRDQRWSETVKRWEIDLEGFVILDDEDCINIYHDSQRIWSAVLSRGSDWECFYWQEGPEATIYHLDLLSSLDDPNRMFHRN